MKVELKWRRFEKLVVQVQKELAPDAVVTHDYRIRGCGSGISCQIDITAKQRGGQCDILIAIDCKDYDKPVYANKVEQFIGLVKDIRANKGVMVAANGFTYTAKRTRENAGLNLYRLVDTEAHDLQTYVNIPAVCDFRGVKNYQFLFHTPTSRSLTQVD
jgi:restriction endonuclease Mrr